jgi:hypothetical protein
MNHNPQRTGVKAATDNNALQTRREIRAIDTKITKIEKQLRKPTKIIINFVFDILWLLELFIFTSVLLVIFYHFGHETGTFTHPLLTKTAMLIIDNAKLIFNKLEAFPFR